MEQGKKIRLGNFLLRLFQGLIIGVSGVLPGVSGGVLCVVFGIYKPVMEVLAAPAKKLRVYWRLLLPVAIGGAIGFFLLVRAVSAVLEHYEVFATCAFAGLILGTLPSLIRTAGREKRTGGSYAAFFISFSLFFTLFMYFRYGVGVTLTPSFFWFVLAGAIWGISIVLPGLSSSAILLFLGLFEPMVHAAANVYFRVLFPLALGGAGAVLLLSRLVNLLYERHFSIMSHSIIGIVVATTIPIIPISFTSVSAFFVELALLVLGFVTAMLFEFFGSKLQ